MSAREVWITGMGLASPLGTTLEAADDSLRRGRSGAVPLADVFDTSRFEIKAACRVPDWDLEAAVGPMAAAPLLGRDDRKSELGWYAAISALRDAFGEDRAAREAIAAAPERCGVHLASGLVSTPIAEAQDELLACLREDGSFDYAAAAARLREVSPWRARHFTDRVNHLIAHRYGPRGPSLVNHGACSSSAVSVGTAARWIREGRVDRAIAGGFESMIHPYGVLSFQLLGALSERADCDPTAVSRPFDRTRDGFVIGEGAGVLVLEAADVARRRGARCRGKVLGLGTSMDSWRVTAPPPDGAGAALAMRAALRDAGVSPSDIGYINAHGTATPLNDGSETAAIRTVFGGPGEAPPVSSTKSMSGHPVAAAGAVEAIFVTLALQGGYLPPTINLHHPDPACDLDYVPHTAREADVSLALSNSFGFGGVNGALVLARGEDAP